MASTLEQIINFSKSVFSSAKTNARNLSLYSGIGLALGLGIFSAGCSTPNIRPAACAAILERRAAYLLGETKIQIKESSMGPGLIYFNMHDDEDTCVKAARKVIAEYGGRLIEIKSKGERDISFTLDRKKYCVDPNRIFSRKGIRKNLLESRTYSKMAVDEVERFAGFLADELKLSQLNLIVAIHNNSKENDIFNSYYLNAAYEKNLENVHIGYNGGINDFFFVNRQDFFDYFKAKGFSVVLLSSAAADDGSLSAYCERNKIPYINVEAQHGHLSMQKQMLEAAVNCIARIPEFKSFQLHARK